MTQVPARRPITVRDLLTHTAGISYGTIHRSPSLYEAKGLGPAAGAGWYTADKDEPVCDTMERLGTLPFVAQPGEAWVYGYNTDVLGCIVEKASGTPLDAYIRDRITAPLGMKDTQFFLPPAQTRSPCRGVRQRRGWEVRARAEHVARPGILCGWSAPKLCRRRGAAVDDARLRALPRGDAPRRIDRRRRASCRRSP